MHASWGVCADGPGRHAKGRKVGDSAELLLHWLTEYRQMNMDYATSKAWSYEDLTDAEFLIWGYDVNCQYQPHHKERVEASEYLDFPAGLEDKIYYAIGTWHVHGHKNECYPQYATSFIKGAGVKSAEILEARWSELNHAAPSLRYMTFAHRAEMLDALMNDMNWKTMVNLCESLMFSNVLLN